MVTRDNAGKVQVKQDEIATRHGAWRGAALGAVAGIWFPPDLIGSATVGAAAGEMGGHLWRGMSGADAKKFDEVIDSGQAALVVVGESSLEQALRKMLKAEKHVARKLDVSTKDFG